MPYLVLHCHWHPGLTQAARNMWVGLPYSVSSVICPMADFGHRVWFCVTWWLNRYWSVTQWLPGRGSVAIGNLGKISEFCQKTGMFLAFFLISSGLAKAKPLKMISIKLWTLCGDSGCTAINHNWDIKKDRKTPRGKMILTLSILFPTSIFTRSFLVQYVSSSLSQFSSLVKVSRLVTSYTRANQTNMSMLTMSGNSRSTHFTHGSNTY